MNRSRMDRILEDWSAVANEARRPPAPPRGMVVKSQALGALLAGAGVVALIAVGLILVRGPRPPVGGLQTTAPSTTASGMLTSPPSPSELASPTTKPSATPFAVGTAQPSDQAFADHLASQYEAALVASHWQAAWAMLSPEQQARWTSYDSFVTDRSAYFHSVGGRYKVGPAIHDAAILRQWVVPDNFPAAPIWPASPDYDRAFVVRIEYPLIAQYNALDVLLVAPDASGHWFIWQLR